MSFDNVNSVNNVNNIYNGQPFKGIFSPASSVSVNSDEEVSPVISPELKSKMKEIEFEIK